METRDLRYNTDLANKVEPAVALAAKAILSEPENTPNHAKRLQWANEAFQQPQAKVTEMLWAIVTDSDIQADGANSSDEDVQDAVNEAIDIFASALP